MVGERQREKGERFRSLHEGDPFLIPNPWDAGTAKVMEALGFPALATTSSGFAFSLGRLDGGANLDEVIEHTRALAAATAVPIAVDLEHGHGPAAAEAAARLDFPFTFTARAENHIRGNPDVDDTIARLRAYEAAGAQRISVGGALAWVAVEAMAASAEAMRDQGDLTSLAGASRIKGWLAPEAG